jgi:hypothetical protein
MTQRVNWRRAKARCAKASRVIKETDVARADLATRAKRALNDWSATLKRRDRQRLRAAW